MAAVTKKVPDMHLFLLARPYKHPIRYRLHLHTQSCRVGAATCDAVTGDARSSASLRQSSPQAAVAGGGPTVETSSAVGASASAAARAAKRCCLGARWVVHVSGRP